MIKKFFSLLNYLLYKYFNLFIITLPSIEEVEFTLDMEPEMFPIRGNASVIDEEFDAENEKWIIDQLNDGNDWAWASVTLNCFWKGFSSFDHLGCCSYLSEEDFINSSDYYDDMKTESFSSLISTLKQLSNLKP